MLCRQWIWLKRFRHRRGYGVHSPFAFDFLTYVVYERGEYYAYRELKKRYPVVCLCGGLHRLKWSWGGGLRPGIGRLWFRVRRQGVRCAFFSAYGLQKRLCGRGTT